MSSYKNQFSSIKKSQVVCDTGVGTKSPSAHVYLLPALVSVLRVAASGASGFQLLASEVNILPGIYRSPTDLYIVHHSL